MRNEAKQIQNEWKEMRNEANIYVYLLHKLMRNGMRFASISHESEKKKFKRKRDAQLYTYNVVRYTNHPRIT
jgi:hypothetical protein